MFLTAVRRAAESSASNPRRSGRISTNAVPTGVSGTQATHLRHQRSQRGIVVGRRRGFGKLRQFARAVPLGREQFVGGSPREAQGHLLAKVAVLVHQEHVGGVEEAAEAELLRIAPCKDYSTFDVVAGAPRPRPEGEG